MWYSTSSGNIELNIPKRVALACSHAGDCQWDVNAAMHEPKIKSQLNKINPKLLAADLAEYGAWNSEELSNHQDNLMRLLWIACNDLKEEMYYKERDKD